MNRIALAGISTFALLLGLGTTGCAADTTEPAPEAPATTPASEDHGVKEVGTFPAGPDTVSAVGVDHWTVYRTSKDVMVVIGQDKANVTRHTATITYATGPDGGSYIKTVSSEDKARKLTFALELSEKGTLTKADGDPNAGYATTFLSKDIDTAALHQQEYGWWGCVGWFLAGAGTCLAAGGACFSPVGVFTGGLSCYGGGLACVGGAIGAGEACGEAYNQSHKGGGPQAN